MFAPPPLRLVAALSILTACAVAACVPALPGGNLDDGAGGAAGSGGAGNTGGTAASGGGGAGMAPGGSAGSPFLLVNDAGRPPNIAVDSKYVYWSDSRRQSIMKVSVQGGQPVVLTQAPGNLWVAVDSDGGVYWSLGGSIFKLGTGGGPPTTLASGSDTYVTRLVVGPDDVFWTTTDKTPLRNRVMKVGRNGGTPTLLATGPPEANAIAVDATNVYWSCHACGTLMKVAVSGGEPIELARSVNNSSIPSSLAVDASSVYWVDPSRGLVMKVGLEGGEPEPAIVATIKAVSVAVDASGTYWTDPLGAAFVAASPTDVRLLGSAGSAPSFGITLDATSVYWIATGAGSIFKAPK